MGERAETELEMARRHVREGEARLERQEALVRKMQQRGVGESKLGEQLAEAIRTSLHLARYHVDRLEEEQEGVGRR
jgi:hypothetical protein